MTPTGQGRYRWFVAGDWNAFFALLLDNMLNLVVLAGILAGGFGFPVAVIYQKMVPGTALGVLVGDIIYTVLAIRLAKRLGRQDITAMPLGLDTPSTIGMALAVLGPAFVAMKGDLIAKGVAESQALEQAALGAWGIGMAVMLVMGTVKVLFSFIGDWVRRHVPQAGLLGSIGGIGLALLAFFPLLDIFKAPVIGLSVLGLVLYALVAKIELPWKLPGAAVAVGLGTVMYYVLGPLGLLGGESFHAPSLSLAVAMPWPTLNGFSAFSAALPYLPIAIPFGILTIVGGINVTESARAAGDDYRTRDILLTEAIATVVAGLCGGVAQSTPYIGHPAYKEMGARAGYTLLTGLAVGLGGVLGCVSFVVGALPVAAVVPLLVFVGLEITSQAFRACPARHAPAVAFSFLPILGDLLLIRQDSLLASIRGAVSGAQAQLGAATASVQQLVTHAAESVNAGTVVGLGHGFILTAMMWGSFFALIIDRQLRKAALFIGITGLMTLVGFVHSLSPTGELYLPTAAPSGAVWHWACGYFALCIMTVALSFSRGARAASVPAEHGPEASHDTQPSAEISQAGA